MEIGVDESFRRVLAKNNLNDFESLWYLKGELVEEGNIKEKSGHSHVERAILQTEEASLCVYIKKQMNYATTLSRFMHRTYSISRREFQNITSWRALGIPTLNAVYCAEVQKPLRGMLITTALDGYQPLDDYLATASSTARSEMLKVTAGLIRCIHEAGWVHRCLFPKHVFVSPQNTAVPARMIDLEKARRAWLGIHDYARDLAAFERRIVWEDTAQRNAFFDIYFGGTGRSLYRRLFMYLIRQRVAQKKAVY